MPLAREIDSLEDVPEYARPGYKQVGEKWVNEDIEDISNLKGALKKERDGRKADHETRAAIEAELKAFKDLGATPEQIRELKKKLEAPPKGGEPEDFERRIDKRVKEVKAEFEPVVAERDALKAELHKMKLTDKIRAAYIAAGGLEEDADLVLKDTEGRFELSDKDKPLVLDEDKDPTGMSPQEFFEKVYKKSRPKFFKGTGAAGGGAAGGSGGSAASAELAKLPPAERLTRARALGTK